ncbi:hypothetical protein CEP53_015333, partial [Fusarium sp. AF-6]
MEVAVAASMRENVLNAYVSTEETERSWEFDKGRLTQAWQMIYFKIGERSRRETDDGGGHGEFLYTTDDAHEGGGGHLWSEGG